MMNYSGNVKTGKTFTLNISTAYKNIAHRYAIFLCSLDYLTRPSRVAGIGRLSAGANMAMKPFVKRVITIFATNASFLRVISIF